MKRIITGHDGSGKSIFTSIGAPIRSVDLGAGSMNELWCTDGPPAVPDTTVDPEVTMDSFVPKVGGTRFRIFRLEPVDQTAAPPSQSEIESQLAALRASVPGLGETLEADNPGMHTTDTVDYIVVLSGEADLELDDGATVHLEPGDCVVQRGTRHAWRNTGSLPFVAAAVMVGAQRA